MTQDQICQRITESLAYLSSRIKLGNSQQWFDENRYVQKLLARFLNHAIGTKFVDLDEIQKNFPALDIGDRANRIAFQITANLDETKWKDTLEKAQKYSLWDQYNMILGLGLVSVTAKSQNPPNSTRKWSPVGLEYLVEWCRKQTNRQGLIDADKFLREELGIPDERGQAQIGSHVTYPVNQAPLLKAQQYPAFAAHIERQEYPEKIDTDAALNWLRERLVNLPPGAKNLYASLVDHLNSDYGDIQAGTLCLNYFWQQARDKDDFRSHIDLLKRAGLVGVDDETDIISLRNYDDPDFLLSDIFAFMRERQISWKTVLLKGDFSVFQ